MVGVYPYTGVKQDPPEKVGGKMPQYTIFHLC